MKFLFRKSRSKAGPVKRSIQVHVMEYISRYTEPVQRKLADRLQNGTNRYSRRKKIFLLACLILTLSTYNIWLISQCFSPAPHTNLIKIHSPERVPITSIDSEDHGIISADKFNKLMKFRSHLDSLAREGGDSLAYNKIISSRPGLIDSLNLLQKLYEKQTKR